MPDWLVYVVGALAVLALLVGVAIGIGARLPREHVVTRRLTLRRPVDEVWAVINDFGGQLTWRSGLKGCSKVSDPGATEVWLERYGGLAMDLATEESTAPDGDRSGRLVRRIVTPGLPFRGVWEYEVASAMGHGGSPATLVALTERGEIDPPLFRLISKLTGYDGSIKTYLSDLAKRFGEPVVIS